MHSRKSWVNTIEPTSYKQIYHYLEQALDECSTLIDNAEIDFYQDASVSMTMMSSDQILQRPLSMIVIQAWSRRLKELRQVRYSHDIRNIETVRGVLHASRTDAFYRCINDESIMLMEIISSRITEQLDSKIPMLADKILHGMKLMEQYFLSFYNIENIQHVVQNKQEEEMHDEYLETAYTYEKSRWLHMLQVNRSLKILGEMSQRIQNVEGVRLSTLSKECQQLAVRCDCTSFPYIFVLPECYNQARQALNSLRTWLHEDMNYNEFIQKSIESLDKKYREAKKAFEISKTQLSQIRARGQSRRFQLTKLEEENEINRNKYKKVESSWQTKEDELTSKRLTYQVYVTHRNKLLKGSMETCNSVDNLLLIKRFERDMKQLTEELPKLKSQVNTIQTRMHCFQQREQNLIEMRHGNTRVDQQIQLALENQIQKETYLKRMENCRDILRYIYKCRKTSDLAQKLFHQLPIITNNHGKNEDDDLSKAVRLVSESLGRDWNRLYWQLPFHPQRGHEALSEDLTHINKKYYRGDASQEQAMDALNKWRRVHTRAKIDDLIDGLEQIRRFDIVQSIEDNVIKPKRMLNIDQEEIDIEKKEIEELNEKLIRFFDKIRNSAETSEVT